MRINLGVVRSLMVACTLAFSCAVATAQIATGPVDFHSVRFVLGTNTGLQQISILVRDDATEQWYASSPVFTSASGPYTTEANSATWTQLEAADAFSLNQFTGADEAPITLLAPPGSWAATGVTQIDGLGFLLLGTSPGPLDITACTVFESVADTTGQNMVVPINGYYIYTVDGDYTIDGSEYPFPPRPETVLPGRLDALGVEVTAHAWGGYAADGDHLQITDDGRIRFRTCLPGSYAYTFFEDGISGRTPEETFVPEDEEAFSCELTQYAQYNYETGEVECQPCMVFGALCSEGVITGTQDYYTYVDAKSLPPFDTVINNTLLDLGPDGYTLGPGIPMLNVQLFYPDSDNDGIVDGYGVAEEDLIFFQIDKLTGEAHVLDATLDASGNSWTAETETLGLFGLAVVTPALPAVRPLALLLGSCILLALIGVKSRMNRAL